MEPQKPTHTDTHINTGTGTFLRDFKPDYMSLYTGLVTLIVLFVQLEHTVTRMPREIRKYLDRRGCESLFLDG